jgi:hypothetical protein
VTLNFLRNGSAAEMFIKFDRYTGRAWKMDGSKEVQWRSIAELKESEKPVSSEEARYDMYLHDFSKGGEAQQVYLSVRQVDRKDLAMVRQ